MKTGDILLISGTSKRAKAIQKFQQKRDPIAGHWNHSGVILVTKWGTYVVEAAEVEGYKLRAAVVVTPIIEYLNSACEWKVLTCQEEYSEPDMEKILFKYTGIPYDYPNLLGHQIIRTLTGWFPGRSDSNAWKRMLCHEFTMKAWHDCARLRHCIRAQSLPVELDALHPGGQRTIRPNSFLSCVPEPNCGRPGQTTATIAPGE